MKKVKVVLSNLKPHPKNPNTHSVEQINELARSLRDYGQAKNIVIWKGYVIAGNGLFRAAQKRKLKTLDAVDVSGWTEERAVTFMLADNRLAEMSNLDYGTLQELMSDWDDPSEIAGFTSDYLDSLTEMVKPPEPIKTRKSTSEAPPHYDIKFDSKKQLELWVKFLAVLKKRFPKMSEGASIIESLKKVIE